MSKVETANEKFLRGPMKLKLCENENPIRRSIKKLSQVKIQN